MVFNQYKWISASGIEINLTSENYLLLVGSSGFGFPPIQYVEKESPNIAGTEMQAVVYKSRVIDLPILVRANSAGNFSQALDLLARAFNPEGETDGQIRSTRADGSTRILNCRYEGGMEMTDDFGSRGNYWQKLILSFRAFDPFWYDDVKQTKLFQKSTITDQLFFPMPPLYLQESMIFTTTGTLINNPGSASSYPVWTITGPGDTIVLKNVTSGKTMNLGSVSLLNTDTVVIDTRPKKHSVLKNGVSIYSEINPASSFWELKPGNNRIQLSLNNATENSSILLEYAPAYFGD